MVHPKKRTHRSKRVAKRVGRQWGDGVRDRLRELWRGSSNRAVAKRMKVNPRRLTTWLADGLPNAENLHLIAETYRVSLDWLLGFEEVPRDRDARTPIGALADGLREALAAGVAKPPPAPDVSAAALEKWRRLGVPFSWEYDVRQAALHRLEQTPASELVREVRDAWWEARAVGRRNRIAVVFRRMAERLTADAEKPTHASQRGAMRERAEYLQATARFLREKFHTWEDLDHLLPSHLLEEEMDAKNATPDGKAKFCTTQLPTNVAGGAHKLGFAYHGRKADFAWYLDLQSGNIEHRKGRWFLEVVESWHPVTTDQIHAELRRQALRRLKALGR